MGQKPLPLVTGTCILVDGTWFQWRDHETVIATFPGKNWLFVQNGLVYPPVCDQFVGREVYRNLSFSALR